MDYPQQLPAHLETEVADCRSSDFPLLMRGPCRPSLFFRSPPVSLVQRDPCLPGPAPFHECVCCNRQKPSRMRTLLCLIRKPGRPTLQQNSPALVPRNRSCCQQVKQACPGEHRTCPSPQVVLPGSGSPWSCSSLHWF